MKSSIRDEVVEVGKYSVDYMGDAYERKIRYQMIGFQEFDKNDKPVGNRKCLYFRMEDGDILPKINTESEVERLLMYPNNTRLTCREKITYKQVVRMEEIKHEEIQRIN